MPEKVRLDKWLWAARFYKTRGLAKRAIEGGKVHCDGQRAKAAKDISVGAMLTIRQGFAEKTVEVIALSEQRRSAADAAVLYCETPESVVAREERAAYRKAGSGGFTPGAAKPNKKERRQLNKLRDSDI